MVNIFITVFLIVIIQSKCVAASYYCMPHNTTCWPNATQWDNLKKNLTGRLHVLTPPMYEECIKQGDDAYKISDTEHGICMQYHDCSKEFCNGEAGWNIPEFSVEVKTVQDIQLALDFANTHNIAVTVKTSGHSYSGSSMGKGTLLIWMHNFTRFGDIKTNFSDTCGTTYPHVIKAGGGQPWADIYSAVGSKYHIVGGGGLTVSAAGGWLMGCGLSAMSRFHGIGIDNVLNFEIVLTNGSHILVDACSHPDLFWALRGGGGGSFGVVTSVHYRLWPVRQVVVASLEITNIYQRNPVTVDKWADKWVDLSPNLDSRWGGYWTLNTFLLYFLGNIKEANRTFLDEVNAWKNSLPDSEKKAVKLYTKLSNSYYDSRGGPNATTDKTGSLTFNIASRLIPRDWVVQNPQKAKETLKWLVRNGFFTFNYLLGGVMGNVATNATAVHPAMRKAIWQIETFGEPMIQKLREVVKDTGAGYNHASKNEPDWRNAFWGPHWNRLDSIKEKYDPSHRLNCWHCVGYIGPESIAPTKPSTKVTPTKIPSTSVYLKSSLTITIVVAICLFLLSL